MVVAQVMEDTFYFLSIPSFAIQFFLAFDDIMLLYLLSP